MSLTYDKDDDLFFYLFLNTVGTSPVLLLYFQAISWPFSNRKNATHRILTAEIKIILGALEGNGANI